MRRKEVDTPNVETTDVIADTPKASAAEFLKHGDLLKAAMLGNEQAFDAYIPLIINDVITAVMNNQDTTPKDGFLTCLARGEKGEILLFYTSTKEGEQLTCTYNPTKDVVALVINCFFRIKPPKGEFEAFLNNPEKSELMLSLLGVMVRTLSYHVVQAFFELIPKRLLDMFEATCADAVLLGEARDVTELKKITLPYAEDFGFEFDPKDIEQSYMVKNILRERNKRYKDHLTGLLAPFNTIQGRGRPPQWPREKLESATRRATARAARASRKAPKIEDVAKLISKGHPNMPQLNGNSLQKLLKRHGISWKEMKTAINAV